MIVQFDIANEMQTRHWDDFVESHANGTPFHLISWIRTIQETYSLKASLFALSDGSGVISGIFPFFLIKTAMLGSRIVSLPFSDYCGPLFNEFGQEDEFIRKIITENTNRVKCIEIRGKLNNDCGLVAYNYYKRHILDLLPDHSIILAKVDKKTIQYSIRKAIKAGIEIREENNEQGIEEFYRLNKLTRKKHGVPSQPVKFFKHLYDNMIVSGNAFILLASKDSKNIAAGLFFKFKDTIYYKYNVSDPQVLSKLTPNHLLTWYAIEQACIKGYRFFDFGRTSPDNVGLMRYKKMWGAEPLDLPYFYHPKIKGAVSMEGDNWKYRIITSVWRSLPDTVVDMIAPLIFKHIG